LPDASFDEFLEWVSAREGKSVYLEVGTSDPDSELPADAFPVAMHVTLGPIEPAHDTDQDRMTAMIRLAGGDRDRLYFDPKRWRSDS
jgi:hypothetical protein